MFPDQANSVYAGDGDGGGLRGCAVKPVTRAREVEALGKDPFRRGQGAGTARPALLCFC